MLQKLKGLDNLGTPKYFGELFDVWNKQKKWTRKNIQDYFFNRTIEGKHIFDGCTTFLILLGIFTENKGDLIMEKGFYDSITNQDNLISLILSRAIDKLKEDDEFNRIFSPENISYDIVYEYIEIRNAAFDLRYSNLKQFFIDFGFLSSHPNGMTDKFIVNKKYKQLFDDKILIDKKKRIIGLDELMERLKKQQINGEQAELFVLEYETKRLGKLKEAKWISPYDVGAGYDIASYNSSNSVSYDRFIEVKSFSGPISFYLSKNEVETAMIRKSSYYLYLIDRDKIGNLDYEPTIIQNPYDNVMGEHNSRLKEIDTYHITKI